MKIIDNVTLAPFTTFKLGGKARYFAAAESRDELLEAVRFAGQAGVPYMIMGGGSNLLVADRGYDGLVIRNQMKGLERYKKDGVTYIGVGAGENWDDFVKYTVSEGLYGIENLSGIPGSVGATPIQNVGAYGADVSSTIAWVEVLNTDTMEFEILTNNQCNFSSIII